jgi:hypothetical protein
MCGLSDHLFAKDLKRRASLALEVQNSGVSRTFTNIWEHFVNSCLTIIGLFGSQEGGHLFHPF